MKHVSFLAVGVIYHLHISPNMIGGLEKIKPPEKE